MSLRDELNQIARTSNKSTYDQLVDLLKLKASNGELSTIINAGDYSKNDIERLKNEDKITITPIRVNNRDCFEASWF